MSSEAVIVRGGGNVFADLGLPDAANHKTKAGLVHQIAEAMRERRLTQTEAARLIGLSQPDISRLLRGNYREVSVDRLMTVLQRLDADVAITVRRSGRGVSETIAYAGG